jgi:kynureninase
MSPRQADCRGSQVSFSHPHGFEIMQALISDFVIGDFRAPDIMRFGFTPLYTRFEDVFTAVSRLRSILHEERWQDPVYAVRGGVVT